MSKTGASKTRSRFGTVEYLGPDYYHIYWKEPSGRKSHRFHGTKREADAYLARKFIEVTGEVPDQPWISFWETVVEPSLDDLAERTKYDYTRVWEKELKPRIAKTMVGYTTQEFVQRVISEIEAPSVQSYAIRLWRKMCYMAKKTLPENPVTGIDIKPIEHRQKKHLDAADITDWLDNIHGIRCEPLLLMEVGNGLSPEEACAMVKENVTPYVYRERTYALIVVERALTMVGSSKVLKEPKNGFRVRECVMGEPFATPLLELSDGIGPFCPGQVPYTGGEYEAKHFVSTNTATNNWHYWCNRNNMEYITPGNLRTVYSTLQGEAGSPDDLVRLSMGHAVKNTRGRHYLMRTRRGMIRIADNLTDFIEECEPLDWEQGREDEAPERTDSDAKGEVNDRKVAL